MDTRIYQDEPTVSETCDAVRVDAVRADAARADTEPLRIFGLAVQRWQIFAAITTIVLGLCSGFAYAIDARIESALSDYDVKRTQRTEKLIDIKQKTVLDQLQYIREDLKDIKQDIRAIAK